MLRLIVSVRANVRAPPPHPVLAIDRRAQIRVPIDRNAVATGHGVVRQTLQRVQLRAKLMGRYAITGGVRLIQRIRAGERPLQHASLSDLVGAQIIAFQIERAGARVLIEAGVLRAEAAPVDAADRVDVFPFTADHEVAPTDAVLKEHYRGTFRAARAAHVLCFSSQVADLLSQNM